MRVAAVGNGTAAMAADFVAQFSVPFPVFTDPSRASYQTLGLRRGLGLNLQLAKNGMRAYKAGFRQGRTQGDPLQQGGVVVMDAQDRVTWLHVDSGAGDHAPMDALRDAVAAL